MRKRDGDQGGEAPLKAVPSAGPARGTCRDARVVLRLKESNLPPGVEAMTEKVCRRWPSALRRKAKPLSRAEPAAPDNRRRHAAEAGDFRLKPRLHRTRNRKFESISLQQTVRLSRDFSFLYRKAGGCRGVRRPGAWYGLERRLSTLVPSRFRILNGSSCPSPGVGHYAADQQPALVNELLLDHLVSDPV